MMMPLKEAISSCAMTHRDGCTCTVCRAAHGDREAYAAVVAGVMLGGTDVLRPRP